MNCDEADGLLLDYVEGELDDSQSAPLRSHLEQCQSCRLHLRDTKKLLGVMDDVKERQEQVIERRAARRSRMGSRSQISSSSQSQGSTPIGVWAAGARLGDFEIVSEIGRGGMGVVYRARQVSLHREVALKILPSAFGTDEKVIARFQREAQAAARLHHTNIVPVYAQGQQDGHFYYAMELIEGESLDHVIRARREDQESPSGIANESVSQSKIQNLKSKIRASGITRTIWTMQSQGLWRDYARLICGAAEGLAHAHAEGVLHRDIKPQNLLLGTDNQLHITDFGLARLLDEPGMTVTGEMLGTPAYMSPEQVAADRRAIDHRTDIFSLGSTFYELLTGQRPFEGSTRDQVIARICTREPKPPRKINPRIPVDLETICLRAMEKETPRRYKSAADMAADLRRYAENRPILARRVGPIEKAVKWVRRHPAMTTIIVLSVGLTLGGIMWRHQTMRARHERFQSQVAFAFGVLAHEDYRESNKANEFLKSALKLESPDAEWELTSALSMIVDQPAQAMLHLQTAQQLAGQNGPLEKRIYYLMAWANRQESGRLEGGARKLLEKGDAIQAPTTAEDHFFRGQALVRHEPTEAAEEFRHARDGRDGYVQAMLHLGRALNMQMYHYRRHDTFDEQKRVLGLAIELNPRKAYPKYLLSLAYRLSAEIYEEIGAKKELADADFEMAFKYARKAQEDEPENPRSYECEAEYWEARRDYVRAIDTWNRGKQFSTGRYLQDVYKYRWRLHYWLNQFDSALADLDELSKLPSVPRTELIWYTKLFPSMVLVDMGKVQPGYSTLESISIDEVSNFHAITSAASLLRLTGQTRKAGELLSTGRSRIDYSDLQPEHAPADWGTLNYELCENRLTLANLAERAGTDGNNEKLIWPAAYFFEACRQISNGDRAQALQYFRKCMATFEFDEYYCYLAKVFVRRMEGDPNWPKWVKKPA
jgi:serine/threonine protein kinase/tetratricopeptide (TPR) repeat protein